jgi:hypothetical protein
MSENDLLSDISIPDPNNPHNYMLDTSAINKLADNFADLELFIRSKSFGFKYYKTANQDYELGGIGANMYDKDCIPTYYKKSETLERKRPLFNEIQEMLEIKRVSSVSSFMRNHWILDGTYRICDDHSSEGRLMQKILDFKKYSKKREKRPFSQHYDAMIAEAAMKNACYLVTNDSDLRNIVNENFPSRAIEYDEIIRIIDNISHFLDTEARICREDSWEHIKKVL